MSGLERYFVAPDAHGDLWVWRRDGDYPVPAIAQCDFRKAPDLWDARIALVEGAS